MKLDYCLKSTIINRIHSQSNKIAKSRVDKIRTKPLAMSTHTPELHRRFPRLLLKELIKILRVFKT
jgi:hypothetical protein